MVPTGYVYENNTYMYGCTYNSNNHTHYYYPFSAINNTAYFWTSSSGKYRYFSYNDTGSYHGTSGTATYAYAVRCVKDF